MSIRNTKFRYYSYGHALAKVFVAVAKLLYLVLTYCVCTLGKWSSGHDTTNKGLTQGMHLLRAPSWLRVMGVFSLKLRSGET